MTGTGCVRLYGPIDEEYDLDNPHDLIRLGLDPTKQHADGYCHFKTCRWLVEERKRANQIKTAVEQLESTVRQLAANNRKVSDTIIVVGKLSRAEQRRFHVDPTTHELRSKDSANGIRILNLQDPVRVIFEKDIPQVILELREYNWGSASS